MLSTQSNHCEPDFFEKLFSSPWKLFIAKDLPPFSFPGRVVWGSIFVSEIRERRERERSFILSLFKDTLRREETSIWVARHKMWGMEARLWMLLLCPREFLGSGQNVPLRPCQIFISWAQNKRFFREEVVLFWDLPRFDRLLFQNLYYDMPCSN